MGSCVSIEFCPFIPGQSSHLAQFHASPNTHITHVCPMLLSSSKNRSLLHYPMKLGCSGFSS